MTTSVWSDTSFLYTFFVKADQNHGRALVALKTLAHSRTSLVTSDLVLSELGGLLSYRFGHETAASRLQVVYDSALVKKLYTKESVDSSAMAWWRRFGDQKFSFTDCVSFEFMRRLGIARALTYDRDFAIAGFEMVGE